MTDWRTQYEDAAEAEHNRLARMTDQQLLSLIARRKTDGYYAVWRVLGSRAATPSTCWALYDVLQGDWEYLDRYHCAAALLQLLRITDVEPVDLSADWPVVPGNLQTLRARMVAQIGEPRR